MTAQNGFTEEELDRAWWLVTNGIEYTQKDLLNLDPPQRRIVQLAEELRVWRAKLPVSEEAKRFQQELRARIRQRKRAFHELGCAVKLYLLHPECIPDEVREIVPRLLAVDWQAFIAEGARQGRAARGRRGTKSPLSLAVKRLNAPDFDSLLNMLEDADLIDDLFEHPSDPIHIHALEVDRETQRVTYSVRYRPKPKSVHHRPKPKPVGFKRLKEIFDGG